MVLKLLVRCWTAAHHSWKANNQCNREFIKAILGRMECSVVQEKGWNCSRLAEQGSAENLWTTLFTVWKRLTASASQSRTGRISIICHHKHIGICVSGCNELRDRTGLRARSDCSRHVPSPNRNVFDSDSSPGGATKLATNKNWYSTHGTNVAYVWKNVLRPRQISHKHWSPGKQYSVERSA